MPHFDALLERNRDFATNGLITTILPAAPTHTRAADPTGGTPGGR